MNSSAKTYLPFDTVWKMRIDHPYSLFVRDGAILWSCGQCPLDNLGNVLHPGDLLRQATAVAGFIQQFLGDMQSQTASVGRLVVYYVKTALNDAARLQELFHRTFGHSVHVIPVAVPHFYYEGMLIEVDVFASDEKGESGVFVDEESGMTLEARDAGPFVWATVSWPRRAGPKISPRLNDLLNRANLPCDTLLSEQWFLPDGFDVCETRLLSGVGRAISNAIWVSDGDADITAKLIFAKTPVSNGGVAAIDRDSVSISLNMASGYFNLTAIDASPDRRLVEQTVNIMRMVEEALSGADLSFKDVRKATTYYIAGSSADELHDNMSVRNHYYKKPGPASTGLPVQGLPTPGARISINLFGVTPHGR